MKVPGVYVVAHKTTAFDIAEGSVYWRRLALDAQVSKHLVGARALGHAPLGVLYDVIRKPALRPLLATPFDKREYTKPKDRACPECKRKGAEVAPHVLEVEDAEGQSTFVQCRAGRFVIDPGGRLYANMRERDETPEEYGLRLRRDIESEPAKYFQRVEIIRPHEDERDAAKDTWELAKQIREAQRVRRWPRNPDACDSYGVFCVYFPVCTGETTIEDPTVYRDAPDVGDPREASTAPTQPVKRRLPLLSTESLKSFRSCQRKYYYAYERRRRSVHEGESRRLAALMHEARKAWWRTGRLDEALATIGSDGDRFELVKAEELVRGYHARWSREALEVLRVEDEFVAPLVNPTTGLPSKTWQQGGTIDAVVRAGAAAKLAA